MRMQHRTDSTVSLGGLAGVIFRRSMTALVSASVSLGIATAAFGQGRVVLGGIADVELWATDSGSRLLTRNNGHTAPIGRLRLWTGVELHPRLQLLAMGRLEGGEGRPPRQVTEGVELMLEQVTLRYVQSPGLTITAGKMPSPIGTFAQRHLSTTNPLIGSPDTYSLSYPLGVQVSGASLHWDYRVAVVDQPVTNRKYMPEPSAAPRLAMGGGFTAGPSLRVGASLTRGPYLNRDLDYSAAPQTNWRDYQQEIAAFDARFSRGYFEFNGELAFAKYDVPGRAKALTGRVYYGEVKYTWSPRLFTAARVEANDYGFVRQLASGQWLSVGVGFRDAELGVGYRLDPRTTLKLSYRADKWEKAPDGHAIAFQATRQFDVMSWFDRSR